MLQKTQPIGKFFYRSNVPNYSKTEYLQLMSNDKIRLYNNLFTAILCVAILIILLVETILNLTPVIDRDAIIHHLAIPKLWLKNGGFYDIKWAIYSYYPMNVDLLYLIPLYFNRDFMAKFIHMGFGIGTALLIYCYLKNKVSRIAGLLGILVFLSTPIVVRLSTEVYVDLGLVFFTTASILAFIRYRDGEYKDFKWLFFSSVAMGLALGTKYNALIAWFFLSMAVVFVCSRDTGEQWKAMKCGVIFFLISLFVFSPWLIKNIILTGNPLYPLFQGFFNVSGVPSQDGTYAIVSGNKYMGIFQMREAMYGERFWETLLIPIRYFFEGKDNSYRFFDGVLNPVLILLPPFAFLNKSSLHDKILFTCFAVFFILMASFLDQTRIRYIFTVIPILSILSALGFVNIMDWVMKRSNQLKYVLAVAFISLFVVLMSKNISYVKNYYDKISPMNYIIGKESKDDFISRHVNSYPAMKFINTFTPENSRIRLIFLAGRGYYLERSYQDDQSMGMNFIRDLVTASGSDESFKNYINSIGYTHLLIRMDVIRIFLQTNYPPDTGKLLIYRMNKNMDVLFNKSGHTVFKIK